MDGRFMMAARISPPGDKVCFPLDRNHILGSAAEISAGTHKEHALLSWTVRHRVPKPGIETPRQNSIARCYGAESDLGSMLRGTWNRHRNKKVSGSMRMRYPLMRHTDVKTTGIRCVVLLNSKQVLPGTD